MSDIDHLADLRMSEDSDTSEGQWSEPLTKAELEKFGRLKFDGTLFPAMSEDEAFLAQINLPTDEQVGRARQFLCEFKISDELIKGLITILLNKDRILGYR